MRAKDLDKQSLVKGLAHPLRAQILGILQERAASPSELSDELGASLGTVAYHVRRLADLKLVRLVRETPRRGAVEHHYEATAAAVISDSTWARAPSVVKQAMAAAALEEIGRSVNQAAFAGGFERADAHLSRTRLELDARGWSELAAAMAKLVEEAERLSSESEERLKEAGHEGTLRSSLVMMLFESEPSVDREERPAS